MYNLNTFVRRFITNKKIGIDILKIKCTKNNNINSKSLKLSIGAPKDINIIVGASESNLYVNKYNKITFNVKNIDTLQITVYDNTIVNNTPLL